MLRDKTSPSGDECASDLHRRTLSFVTKITVTCSLWQRLSLEISKPVSGMEKQELAGDDGGEAKGALSPRYRRVTAKKTLRESPALLATSLTRELNSPTAEGCGNQWSQPSLGLC